ncbi:MAG TPA: ferredoxin [Streptosporangiaceae bacterium]|nr:ferredoxin [Streptosporangiaceae bacterium]
MTLKLEVDPIACDGHGLCADLLPELVELDEWGYPMIHDRVPAGLAGHARRAVSACPALALKLSRVPHEKDRSMASRPGPAVRR